MRGRRKALVAGLLGASAAATGALAGFAVGIAFAVAGARPLGPAAGGALVGAALVGDLLAARTARARPLSVGRQVPREWSRLFSPPTVALLYGARLGVGPATILPSWLWWALLVLAASQGVWASTAAGAAFGLVRIAVMVATAEWVRHAAAARMARLRRAEPAVRLLLAPLALAVVLLR